MVRLDSSRRKPRGLNLGLMLGSKPAWTWHWVHPVWVQVLDHLLIPVWTPVQLVAQALQVVVRALWVAVKTAASLAVQVMVALQVLIWIV